MTNRRDRLAFGILGGLVMGALAVTGSFGGRLARAESAPLVLDIYTADSQGLGVTSTLIYGDQEAILVDTQFRIADAEKLADRIAAKGRRLKAILITHPHFSRIHTSITSMAPPCCSSAFPARPSTRAPPTSSTSRAAWPTPWPRCARASARKPSQATSRSRRRGRARSSRWTVRPWRSWPVCRATWARGRGTTSSGFRRWPPRSSATSRSIRCTSRSAPPTRIPARPGKRRCASSRSGIPARS